MSGSEAGVMTTSREPPFSMNQKSPVPPQPPVMQNMRLAFASDGTPLYKSITPTSPTYHPAAGNGGADGAASGGPGGGPGSDQVKRKRGRPRKYGPDGTMALSLMPTPPSGGSGAAAPIAQANNVGFSSPPPPSGSAPPPPPLSGGGSGSVSATSPTSSKKARGRPPGSTKKLQHDSLGAPGVGFTPHVITVKAGEDVSSKIMSFSQNGPRAVCILSANGAISNVTLRQPATSGGTVTYEGRFEILSLSGSFLLTEYGGQRSRTGGLSVSLSGPDGRVLGGGVAGLLTAASPVQVIVGSFIAECKKESNSSHQTEPYPAQPKLTPSANSPPSRGTLSESSGGPSSPLNQSTGACNNNNNPQAMSSMPWK